VTENMADNCVEMHYLKCLIMPWNVS